jgi:hypothetical protein
MSKAAKAPDIPGGAVQEFQVSEAQDGKLQDGDVLHFLTRTLQAHFLDAEPQHMLEKLQTLQDALAEQERTLADWPDSPSKDRICAALTKAKRLVAQIVENPRGYELEAIRGAKAS